MYGPPSAPAKSGKATTRYLTGNSPSTMTQPELPHIDPKCGNQGLESKGSPALPVTKGSSSGKKPEQGIRQALPSSAKRPARLIRERREKR